MAEHGVATISLLMPHRRLRPRAADLPRPWNTTQPSPISATHIGKRLAGKLHEPFERAGGGRAITPPLPTLPGRGLFGINMPTCAHALPGAAMAACSQCLAIRGQRLFKGAVGHADRAEHPAVHDFGEGNPDRINERELLDHDAST